MRDACFLFAVALFVAVNVLFWGVLYVLTL